MEFRFLHEPLLQPFGILFAFLSRANIFHPHLEILTGEMLVYS